MISLTRVSPGVDGAMSGEPNSTPTTIPDPAHATPSASAPSMPGGDPWAALQSAQSLHKDVVLFARGGPGGAGGSQGTPGSLDAKKDVRGASKSETAGQCATLPKSYDVATTTQAEIDALRQCGQRRLADTIDHARSSYADLLAQKPPVKIVVTTSAGNGGEPVMVVRGPRFDPSADAHVHTHYHGDNATVADPLGSKAGLNARIREVITQEDPQAVFVLPEAGNAPSTVDSPSHDNRYSVGWGNVKSQVQTTQDALAAIGVTRVGERVVSAHSGGGMALVNLVLADRKGGALLQADRLELYDCVYHFGQKQDPSFFTEQRLRDWSKTPNGQAVKQVIFYRGSNDAGRAKVLEEAFPARNGHATFRMIDMASEPRLFDKKGRLDESIDPVAHDANGQTIPQQVLVPEGPQGHAPVAHHYKPDAHYRTVGEFLGSQPRP